MFRGPIRQFGFVVADLDAAVAQWADVGVAPWRVNRGITLQDCRYRGERTSHVISVGLAYSGDLQIELIQQEDDSPSVFREFLDRERTTDTFHQIAYEPDDFEATRDAAIAAGWTEVLGGDANGLSYCYLERADAPTTVVELVVLNDALRATNDRVRAAAAVWEPGQPVVMT